jgi:NAD(P)H dehydrogenase (quinone)
MTSTPATLAITGASGQLGLRVIDALLKKVPASRLIATARNPEKIQHLAAQGVTLREADYDRPETLERAFAGVDTLLLISASEIGKRVPQHLAVIEAAKRAGVKLLAYTSLLHADTSPLSLAEEHRQTEAAIKASGIPYVLLRNGWYAENYLGSLPVVLEHHAVLGSAGEGRISWASRDDYAEAIAAVLTSEADQAGRVYELAGDQAYTLSEYAAEIARQSGKPIVYNDMPEAAYKGILLDAGLPEAVADMVASSDAHASKGALYDASGQISRLTGHPTVTLEESVAQALKA